MIMDHRTLTGIVAFAFKPLAWFELVVPLWSVLRDTPFRITLRPSLPPSSLHIELTLSSDYEIPF
jgi:hypothetical protein